MPRRQIRRGREIDRIRRRVAHIPGDPVEALLGRAGDGPDNVAIGVSDGQQDRRFGLPALGLELGAILEALLAEGALKAVVYNGERFFLRPVQ